jgi:uncharacterized membrane protein
VADERKPRFDPVAGGRARHRDESEVEFNRIVAFSDGVFAIAITLLVLGLSVPPHQGDLTRLLLNDQDDFVAYGISFAVLGRYWLSHHRFFSSLERFDGRLMALNLLYLACIALVPFTSQVLGDYSGHTQAVILYAINMILVTGSFYAQVAYSDRAGLIRAEARSFDRTQARPTSIVVIGVFVLSIPVAFASPLAASLMWLAIFFTGAKLSNRIGSSSS